MSDHYTDDGIGSNQIVRIRINRMEYDGTMDGSTPAARRALDDIELRATPGHLLRRAQQRAVDLFLQSVGEDGLRPPQFALLLAAYQNPGANQTDLVRATGIDRSTAADMITRLANRGLIQRSRTEADGRANRLEVTAKGIAALDAAAERAMDSQERIMAPIPPGQRAQFLKNLARIADLDDGAAALHSSNKKSGEGT